MPAAWSPPRAAVVALAVALAGATCAEPLQSGGVIVAAGAGERLGVLCRWRHGEIGAADVCPAAPAAAPARVRRLAGGDGLSGPLAIGRAGDYLLENDEIALVVDQLGAGTGFAESGGNLVDAADARVRRDELGQVFTYFGVFPRQALYEDLEAGVDPDGAAWIEVRGRELHEPALAITTRYALRPGDRALLITTALENKGGAAVAALELGDAVQWGATEKVAPGKEPGFRGDYAGPYLAGIGTSVAYALVPAGVSGPAPAPTGGAVDPAGEGLTAKNGAAWSNASFARGVALTPGARVEYARALAIAPRGDPLGIATELLVLGGGAPGGIALELAGVPGAAAAPVAGKAWLARLGPQGRPAPEEIALWLRTGDGGAALASAEAPPGRYRVRFEGSGRRALQDVDVEVRPGEVTPVRLALSEAGRLAIAVREVDPPASPEKAAAGRRTPAKLTLFDAATGAPVMPPLLAISGDASVPIAPGRYRVVASRGPELSIAEATVEVRAGGPTPAELLLARVVDTSGYLACDLHQHTALSADAGVALEDRVLSNVVEGVECAVASEHNLVADLSPVVQALGLAPRFRSIAGEEVTSDASREPFGHVNVFPMQVNAGAPRGGAVRVRDRTAREVFDDLLAIPGERVIQVNHPRTGRTGYFDQLGFDPKTGAGAAPGYDARFDAVEVWSGRHASGRARVLEDLWGLLRASHPVTPTASTDTHGILRAEAGYPRTYVAVGDDDPARLDPAALVDGLRRRRDVILTNGPFVTMRAGEARHGGLASAGKGGRLAISVRVERAPWVDASELRLWIGGVAGEAIPLPGGRTTAAGAILDEVTVQLVVGKRGAGARPGATPIRVDADTFVVAVVQGRRPLEPVLSGAPDEILPFAMTSPLWIDADGDGRALGR